MVAGILFLPGAFDKDAQNVRENIEKINHTLRQGVPAAGQHHMGEIDVPELVNPVVCRIFGGLTGVVDIGGFGVFPDLEQIVLFENLNNLLGKIAVCRALDTDRVVAGDRGRVCQKHEG